jgi:hypothetical protein
MSQPAQHQRSARIEVLAVVRFRPDMMSSLRDSAVKYRLNGDTCRKDWHSVAIGAVLSSDLSAQGCFRDPAPPALSPMRGFGGAARCRHEPNGGSQCQNLPRSHHLRNRRCQ